jgi:hypothetical protein
MLKKFLACSLLTVGITACATDGDLLSQQASAVASDPTPAPPIALRISHMEVRDPHIFSDAFFCSDITALANALLDQSLTQDKGPPTDGSLDINILPVFSPLAPDQATTGFALDLGASCTVPMASTACTSTGAQIAGSTANNQATGTCLAPLAGTTFSGYTPAISNSTGPCFASNTVDTVDVSLGTVTIHMTNAQIAGTYTGSPTSLSNGLLRGFVSIDQARATLFPASLPLVGGKTLAQLLSGGDTICTRPGGGSDLDTGPDGVTKGWYFYINYSAVQVPYTPFVAPPPPAPDAGVPDASPPPPAPDAAPDTTPVPTPDPTPDPTPTPDPGEF